MQVDSVARTRHSLHLRSLLIERHFSEPQPHRTSYGLRCWSDRLFSSEDFLQVDSVARTRHSLDLRSLLIEQHSSLTRYSICFRKTCLTFDPLRLDSGILDCRNLGECAALFSSHQREALVEADTLQVAHASAECADCGGLRYSPLCDGIRYSSGTDCYLS